jgi:serine phosphatase RsbU (regulator of sigma subunit)/anti-sigma regulatory factor (Ser/Thr protein kinase)
LKYRNERAMLRSGDRMQERLALLVRAGEMFHRSLEVAETLDNVARMAVESFTDLCLFDMIDEHSERLYVTAGAHRDPSMDVVLKNVGSSILYDNDLGIHPAVRVAQTGKPFFVPVFDEAAIHLHAASANHAAFMRRMGYRSKIVVPVIAHGHIFGALSFVRTADTVPFDEQDVDAAQELGRRAGLAVANAKQFHREQHVAATLQRAFLTEDFPRREGLVFHAIYRAGKGDAELGGDWYDAFTVADGSIVITIGDVTGKGIEAARLMVQLRQSVRVGATIDADPGAILRIVNETLLLDRGDAIATAFVGTIAPDSRTLRYASAGHPPPFLRGNDAVLLSLSGSSPPLGIRSGLTFDTGSIVVGKPSTLVMYTDGVTESTRDAIEGERMLRAVLGSAALDFAANPARFVERVVDRTQSQDDVAVMTVRFGARKTFRHWDVADPAAAYALKGSVLAALREIADFTDEQQQNVNVIFSELVGNAVRHAPGALSIAISAAGGKVCLHVIDEGPGFDRRAELPSDIWSESGRGLFLISALAKNMTVEPLAGFGSYVTVELQFQPRKALGTAG